MNEFLAPAVKTTRSRTALPPQVQSAFAQALTRNLFVAESALQGAIDHAEARSLSLLEALVALALVSERDACPLLAEAAGLFYIDPAIVQPSPLAVRLVPGHVARRHELLPLAVDDRKLTYITSRPFDPEAEKDVAFASGRRAMPALACASDLRTALDRIYPATSNLHRVLAQPRTAPVEPIDPARRPVVLIADDQAIMRTLVHLLLDRDGYAVVEADHGARTLELAATHRPALVVMDLHMPHMNGYDAIAALRRMPGMNRTPVVVVTAEDGPVVEQQVLALGADDYIAKPFEPSVLTARIKAVFARQRMAA